MANSNNQRRITSYECSHGHHSACSRNPRHVMMSQLVCECECHDTSRDDVDEAPVTTVRLLPDQFIAPDGGRWWTLEIPAIAGQTREWGAMLHESHVAQLVAGLERLKAALRAQRADREA